MLVNIDYKNKSKTLYKCDRCDVELTTENRKIISVNGCKKWDLCPKCYRALERGINTKK